MSCTRSSTRSSKRWRTGRSERSLRTSARRWQTRSSEFSATDIDTQRHSLTESETPMTTFSDQIDCAAKELLVKLYFQGELYPELAIAELHTPKAYSGLECWYATQRAGEHSRPPMELMQRLAEMPRFQAALSGDYLAVNGPLPPKMIVEFGLLPIGEQSRHALEDWMERHATEQLGVALMERDLAQEDDAPFQRHIDTMLSHVGLLTALMPHFGVHTPIQILDSGATTLQVGHVTARLVATGWQVERFSAEEPDLSVINMAALIGTPAALDFIANYSDTTSPAHDIALRGLARALGREAELDAMGARGGGQ